MRAAVIVYRAPCLARVAERRFVITQSIRNAQLLSYFKKYEISTCIKFSLEK